MSGTDDDFDAWDSEADIVDEILEGTDDEVLTDQYNRTLVATREIDDQDLDNATREFQNTSFLELIKDVHVLRVLYGPSDPTINDLAEEIESSLKVILEQVRKDPMGLILEIAKHDQRQLHKAKKVIDDLLKHLPPASEGGTT